MKKCIVVIIASLVIILGFNMHFSIADTWSRKADFGGTKRSNAVGFSIGNKGYIGTGSYSDGTALYYYKDFWECDPALNSWTQKADFGGGERGAAVGFSIGNKGYVGTGQGGSYSKDFWEYDPALNSWIQKNDFGGGNTASAVGFSIGTKGYIGNFTIRSKDFWEYDPALNSWTRKADFEGSIETTAVGFSIGSKGYIGTGYFYSKEFWEYDPALNSWTQKADFGGSGRIDAVGFSIGNKGYIGMGYADANTKDFWEYDPTLDSWTKKSDFGGGERHSPVGISIGNKGYIVTGEKGSSYYKDFWEYDPNGTTDTTPDQFTFTDQTGVALNTSITSNSITVSGITSATPISITGGTYSINGGAYTSAGGTVNNGNTVTVQQTSSGSYSTTTNATLTIGGVSDTFSVTTTAGSPTQDTIPNQFTFTDQTNVELNTSVTSNNITVSGINAATPISIIGGTYSINGGSYTSGSGSVNNGNTVTVKLTSSGSSSTKTDVTLNIGGISDTFSVTTKASPSETPPNQFTFNDQTGVALNTGITSNSITVSGITAPASISITGGTYSVNAGAYTSASGTVNNGDTVTVQVSSSASYSTTMDATLTIGGVTDTFSVTTKAKSSGGGDGGGGGGCFIATAAFGSSMAGQVEILRQFRDRYLLTNAWGKKFVAWYYRNGPVAANFIKDKPVAKVAVQMALYPLIGVSLLLMSGYLPFVTLGLLLSVLLFLRFRTKELSDI